MLYETNANSVKWWQKQIEKPKKVPAPQAGARRHMPQATKAPAQTAKAAVKAAVKRRQTRSMLFIIRVLFAVGMLVMMILGVTRR